jgi:hypothetical protein
MMYPFNLHLLMRATENVVGEPQGRGRERGPESVPRPTITLWTYERLDFGQTNR